MIKEEAINMVQYMMNKRNVEIKDLIVETITHTVENKGSVIASVVYINDDIIE